MATGRAGHFVAHFVAMARNNAWATHRLLRADEALTPQFDEFFLAGEQALRCDELRELALPGT